MTLLIGFTGPPGSGKNAAADHLIDRHDFRQVAFADPIRQAALANRVTYYTTMAGCEAAVEGMKHQDGLLVQSLQELHAELA